MLNSKKIKRQYGEQENTATCSRLQDENWRDTFQKQLNIKLESLKFDNVEDGIGRRKVEDGIISGKQFVKFLMVSYGRKLRIQLGILVKKLYV